MESYEISQSNQHRIPTLNGILADVSLFRSVLRNSARNIRSETKVIYLHYCGHGDIHNRVTGFAYTIHIY